MNIEIIHLVCTQNFPKTNISYFVIRTRTCTYQRVKNMNFLENFTHALNEWSHSEWQSQWYFVISLNLILQNNFEVTSFIYIFTKFTRFYVVYIIYVVIYIIYRRSHSEMIYEMVSSKELYSRCFPVNFLKFYRAVILRTVGERLFLFFTSKDLFKVSYSNTRAL